MAVKFNNLLQRIAYASGENISPDGRNSNVVVIELMNAELELYHDFVLERSDRALLRTTVTTSSATTVGADGFPANERVLLPTAFSALRSASIGDGQHWRQLARLNEHERTESLDITGVPIEAEVANGADGTTVLRLSPPANSAYTIEILYLPKFTAGTNLESEFELLPGGADWIVYGTAIRIMQANGAEEAGSIRLAQEQYARAVGHVEKFAAKQNRSGPSAMRETDREDLYDRRGRWVVRGL